MEPGRTARGSIAGFGDTGSVEGAGSAAINTLVTGDDMDNRTSADDRGMVAVRPQRDTHEWLLAALLAAMAVPLASSALVLRVAIWTGASFHVAACVLAVVVAVILALVGWLFLSRRPRWNRSSRRVDKTALLALALACLSAALCVVCLQRSDADDVIYLPKIVYAVAHPGTPMDGTIHEIAHAPALALPLSAAPYYPTAYEFAQAALAHVSGIDLLWIYYRLAPVLTAMFGVFLLAANLRCLGLPWRASAIGALLAVPLLLLMGDSHRALGNFTLVRMFQSKCAFIFLGLQMFIALSLVYFRKPGARSWALLIVGVTALSGITTSALVMLPLLSLPLFLGWWFAYGHGDSLRRTFGRGLAYAAALAPTLLFALDYRKYALARAGYGSTLNAGFPDTFHGQLDLVIHGSMLSPAVLFLLASVLVLGLFWREPRHRFLLATTALIGLFYLNPWMASPVMRYLTSENIYWRLFYLPPLLLMMGAAVGVLFERVAGGRLMRKGVPFFCFAVLAGLVVVSPTSVMHQGNHVEVALHGYPLGPYADDARACLRLARPGVVLAPVALAQEMAVLSASHTQVVTRRDFLANALFAEPDELARRMGAAKVITGKGGRLGDLVAVLQQARPSTVVIARAAESTALAATLRHAGLQQEGATGRWIVYGRAAPADRPAADR